MTTSLPYLFVILTIDAYNFFLTSAMDSSINLWDIRAPSVISNYNSHVNRSETISCDISPCLRYIATGDL